MSPGGCVRNAVSLGRNVRICLLLSHVDGRLDRRVIAIAWSGRKGTEPSLFKSLMARRSLST
jgi:hypothetical protein